MRLLWRTRSNHKMTFCFFLTCCLFMLSFVSSLFTDINPRSVIPAERICKPGPPLKETPEKINCLIIGDSISIGYNKWVAASLGPRYQVQHAPWDHSDGGALDSKYGLQCLQLFLLTAMLETTTYDVIIFNFGMHDINYNDQWPEEYTAPTDYAKNLEAIKSILLSTGANVGYVLTTPVPYNITINNRVKQYNRIASHVMHEHPAVATADLYNWVIEGCQNNCVAVDKDLGPHFSSEGYRYMSKKVKDLILGLTQNRSSWSLERRISSTSQTEKFNQKIAGKPSVPCRNTLGNVVTVCSYNSTCCSAPFSNTGQGCCLTPQAIPCGDGNHCCPAGYGCDPNCSYFKCSCHKT